MTLLIFNTDRIDGSFFFFFFFFINNCHVLNQKYVECWNNCDVNNIGKYLYNKNNSFVLYNIFDYSLISILVVHLLFNEEYIIRIELIVSMELGDC